MTEALADLARAGDEQAVRTWLASQKKAPKAADLLAAAIQCDNDGCRRLLVEEATVEPVKPKRPSRWNDAHAAAILGDPALLSRALERGAKIEASSLTGTPLVTAIMLGHTPFVRALLELEVNATKAVKTARQKDLRAALEGRPVGTLSAAPLGIALQMGRSDVVEALVEHVPLAPSNFGDALWSGDPALVDRVCDALGGNVPPLDAKLSGRIAGYTLLDERDAAVVAVLRVLIARGIRLRALVDKQWRRLASAGERELLRAWSEHCEAVPATDALFTAALRTDDPECRSVLVDLAARAKAPKDSSWNAAHVAALQGNVHALDEAVRAGADLGAPCLADVTRASQGTPLHVAIRLGHRPFVEALIEEYSVSPTAEVEMERPGQMGIVKTAPLALALSFGRANVVEYLRSYEALAAHHVADAVASGDPSLISFVCSDLGADAALPPSLLVEAPNVGSVQALADAGLDLGATPQRAWMRWARTFFSWNNDERLRSFQALLNGGVPASAVGLYELMRHHPSYRSKAFIDLFLAQGADLTQTVSRFDETGSVAEMLFDDLPLEAVKYLHARGTPLRPQRVAVDAADAKAKAAWLREVGLTKELSVEDFTALERPSPREVATFLATDEGLLGLTLGMKRSALGAAWDLTRVDFSSGHFTLDFSAADELVHVQLSYRAISSETGSAIYDTLRKRFGAGKGKGNRRKWKLAKGSVEWWDSAREGVYVTMA
ncbi:MAG: ankyrin repeat domain-containing protein [Myxococcota bacterium]